MKQLWSWGVRAAVLSLVSACSSPEGDVEATGARAQRIIYGADDRVEADAASGAVAASASALSAALIDASRLDVSKPEAIVVSGPTLRERFGLCASERFEEQITAASCSGTLIAPDLLLTAGHCVTDSGCGSLRVVFGYRLQSNGTLATTSADRVRSCQSVVARSFFSDIDYAVVRLDQPVVAPLPKLKVGALPLAVGRSVLVAGNPSGLPTKVTAGAAVTDGRPIQRDFFLTDLDSFPGNSGSGVFAEDTGELVGVLARGPNPGYERLPGESCVRPERATADSPRIEAVYLHHPLAGLCAAEPQHPLCVCGNGACDAAGGETTATCAADCGQRCGDGECNGSENGNGCYADCGRCGNGRCEAAEQARLSCVTDCGCPPGTVRDREACVPARGNLNGDERVDEDDVRWLAERACVSDYSPTADVDCDGRVDERDARALSDYVRQRAPRLPCDEARGLALGAQHSCALLGGGRVRCWGANDFGQLGTGLPGALGDDEPIADAPVVALGARAVQIAAGAAHSCALLEGGKVRCWGEGASGKLGVGDTANIGDDESPSTWPEVKLGARAVQVAAGGSQSCALLENGTVRCWGDNQFGQLGTGEPSAVGDDEAPLTVPALRFGSRIQELALGFDHSCALAVDGSVRCWGGNLFGQLGRGDWLAGGAFERASDAPAVELGGRARRVFAGPMTTCALREDGAVLCWGQNFFGELGYVDPVIGDDERPLDVGPAPLGAGVEELTLGQNRTCARYSSGELRCWGVNFSGELGYGNALPVESPPSALPAVPLGARAQMVRSGFGHTCALVAGGRVRCWGAADSGQLGYGSTASVGAENTAAEAGDVPMTQRSDPRWAFVNPFALKVWLRQHDEGARGVRVALFVENGGAVVQSDFRAWLAFSRAEAPSALPVLREQQTPWSRASLEAPASTFNLLLDFHGRSLLPGRATSGGSRFGEQARVAFLRTPGDAGQRARDEPLQVWNDYSMSDSSAAWRVTRRVQLVDSEGVVTYGYAIR